MKRVDLIWQHVAYMVQHAKHTAYRFLRDTHILPSNTVYILRAALTTMKGLLLSCRMNEEKTNDRCDVTSAGKNGYGRLSEESGLVVHLLR